MFGCSTWARNCRSATAAAIASASPGDADAMAAAVAERQFLAQVEHPNIVRIYNVVQTEEQLKLIDMGGVRGIDSEGPVYGTVGYQAPEIAAEGPSVASDLFTVARALAVLTFEFKGYQSSYKFTFPDGVPLLEQQESFARLLRRATDADPDRRFGSAGEMAEQLTGVLREVLATADGTPRPAFSTVFSPELQAILAGGDDPPTTPPAPGGTHPPSPPLGGTSPPTFLSRPPTGAEIIAGLPMPQVDRADPAAG